MSKKKTKKRGGFGTFVFGSFIGFILCIALIAGTLAFAYFKVSPNWINKTFKTNIDLGSDEANNKTVQNFVDGIIGLAKHKDTYTINNLKTDFGIEIKDELFGIKITDLKDVAVEDLAEAIENKFGTISADELRNVSGMNLEEEMGKILNKTNTYYFNSEDSKLYKKLDKTQTPVVYSEEINFDYVISEDKANVTTKDHETSIVSGEAKIELWYLPLTVALGDFTSNMGDNITLYDLEESYGVTLPSFIKLTEQEKKDTTVNELEDTINGTLVADILGLTKDVSSGTYYEDKNEDGVKDDGEEVSYVLNTIAGKPVDQLTETINGFTIAQIFPAEELEKGILSLLADETKISEIPTQMDTIIKNTTLATLISEQVIAKPADYDDLDDHVTTVADTVNGGFKTVAQLTLPEMIDYCLDLIELSKTISGS